MNIHLSPSPFKSNENYTYSCSSDCSLSGGYCGDGSIQPSKEECDKASYINPSPSTSSASSEYICDTSCEFSGGYCGDGLVQYSYEIVNGIKEDINVLSQEDFVTSHRDYEYTPEYAHQTSPKYTYTCGSGCLSNGGYCGDSFLELSMEECDYRNFNSRRPTPAESSESRQYDCNANCFYTGGWCGDGIVQDQYGENCDDENCYESCSVCGYGYYLGEEICDPCPIDTHRSTNGATNISQCLACSVGEYATSASRYCSSCSNKASNSTYIGVGGGTNDCPYLCNLDYYSKDSGVTCSEVGIGYFSPAVDNNRTACTNSTSTSNFSYTSDGGGINNCDWSCNTDYYLKDGNCVAVGTGYYSPNNNNNKIACTNSTSSDNFSYTSSGDGTNNCDWSCDLDYYLTEGNCVAVGIGYFSPNNDNSITKCTNGPSDANYTSSGGGENNCIWACNTDYYLVDGNCTAVGIGYYSPNNDNSITECTNSTSTSNFSYTSSGDGTNNCDWSCDLDYYLLNGVCTTVGTGYYSPNNNNNKIACTNSTSSDNFSYTSDGGGINNCDWSCDLDYYLLNGVCTTVGTGYYSPNNDNNKIACTNGPSDANYTSSGGGTNNCDWSCNAGYYSNGTSCVACPIDTYRATLENIQL